jgi:alkylated DNA repair dioxygenase AlkB
MKRAFESSVVSLPCKMPKKDIFASEGFTNLDGNGNALVVLKDVLSVEQLQEYLQKAQEVPRESGRSAFGHAKPRKELCYTTNGQPYKYSNIYHKTIKYPEHVKQLLDIVEPHLRSLTKCANLERNHAVDIEYGPEQERGGSIGRHQDNEHPDWAAVIIVSFGQTRVLRIRHCESGKWYNVPMTHNSVVCMWGPEFQKDYTHQVDKLAKDENVGTRLSLNVRYLVK